MFTDAQQFANSTNSRDPATLWTLTGRWVGDTTMNLLSVLSTVKTMLISALINEENPGDSRRSSKRVTCGVTRLRRFSRMHSQRWQASWAVL